jgi:exonuclease VII large subunit
MKARRVVFSGACAFFLLWCAMAAYAHHGIVAWFDMSRSITVKGTVTSFEWTNPHSYIYFDVKDEKGANEKWSAEMGGVPMLGRASWRRETVKPGDQITLIGKPAKDGRHSILLEKAILANGQELAASDQGVAAASEGAKVPKK